MNTDHVLLEVLQRKNKNGGSTALCALFKKDVAYVINLGDSIAYIINDNKPIKLNKEHNAREEEEKMKVEEKGGVIIKNRVLGSLVVTRSFGDKSYKPYISSEPDIHEYRLSKSDELLLLGTDGFWNVKFSLSKRSRIKHIYYFY
jgi:serine/threonine protein phosphatase PrpC